MEQIEHLCDSCELSTLPYASTLRGHFRGHGAESHVCSPQWRPLFLPRHSLMPSLLAALS